MNPAGQASSAAAVWRCLRKACTRQGVWFLVRASLIVALFELLQHEAATDHLLQDCIGSIARHIWPAPLPKKDVVVVRLTQELRATTQSRDNGEVSHYYPRVLLAALIREIAKTKPRAIVLDVFLDQPRRPEEDEQLASALRSAGNVLLAQGIRSDSAHSLSVQSTLSLFATNARASAPSFFAEDSDGVFRHFPLRFEGKSGLEPSLPSLAAAQVAQLDWKAGPESRRFDFHYTTTNAFENFAAEGILRFGELKVQQTFPPLADAINSNTIVVIAPFYGGSHDLFRVPRGFGNVESELHGGYLLAFAIRTLLNDGGGAELAPWLRHLVTLAFLLCGFGFVFIQLAWPRNGLCDWRLLPPMAYVIFASVLVIFDFYLPMTLPFVAYMLGHYVGVSFWGRFGPHAEASIPDKEHAEHLAS